MKALLFLLFTGCVAFTALADGTPFALIGDATKIAGWYWDEDEQTDASGTLSTGEQLQIVPTQTGISVRIVRNGVGKELQAIDGDMINIYLVAYEYDFDRDGNRELLIVNAFDINDSHIRVYRNSQGILELVGNFQGQFGVQLDRNRITLPYGSQGLRMAYIYEEGAFFELVYHDPAQ